MTLVVVDVHWKINMRRNPVIMMCYKDKTWCSHSRDCGNATCDRNFTEEEREKAIVWWGEASFPIAMADFKTEDCGFINVEN